MAVTTMRNVFAINNNEEEIGMNYRTEKRKANVGEHILITNDALELEWADHCETRKRYHEGDVLAVTKLGYRGSGDDYVVTAETPSGKVVNVNHDEYEVIVENTDKVEEEIGMELQKRGSLLVKAVPTPDYQETIGFIENEDGTYSLNFAKMPGLVFVSYDGVGSFDQLFVHGEFKAEAQRVKIESAVGELTKYTIESSPVIKTEVATLHAGETAKPASAFKPITAQEHRDEIIEMAKRDVAELTYSTEYTSIYYLRLGAFSTPEYIVNKEKRTVVALLKPKHTHVGKSVRAKGIAKCAPTDCFNVHIGKAIALRRALGLEVPAEYLNAPQPTEVQVGDKIYITFNGRIETVRGFNHGGYALTRETPGYVGKDDYKIIDDSRGGGAE